jgi:hypothetical protein
VNFQSCFEALEKQNEEYMRVCNSSEMFIGKTVKVLLTLNLKRIFICIKMAIKAKLKRNDKKEITPFFYARGQALEPDKKVVVYSCIVGGYDELNDPLLYDDSLDYFIVSDKNNEKNRIWKYKNIPNEARQLSGGYINRFCKLNPYFLFPNYDYSIYIDGNIEIVSDISSLCSIARDSKIGIAMHLHDQRDCVYNESFICKLYNRGVPKAIDRQMERYRHEKFPEHFGMVEASIVIVDLNNENAKKIMQDWWNEFLNSGSGRDQLSIPYVLWKNGFDISDVGCLGNNRRRNFKFRTKQHRSEFSKEKK